MYWSLSTRKQIFISKPKKFFLQKKIEEISILDYFSNSFYNYNSLVKFYFFLQKKIKFSLVDFGFILAQLGIPNNWSINKDSLLINKWTFKNDYSSSSYFIPFPSVFFSSKFFFHLSKKTNFYWKISFDYSQPYFFKTIPMFIFIKNYITINLNATLIATLIKKKFENDHTLIDVLWTLNIIIKKSDKVRGFMLLIKGRYSRQERASKVFVKKGLINNTLATSNIDFCKLPVALKYGAISIWLWILLADQNDEKIALL